MRRIHLFMAFAILFGIITSQVMFAQTSRTEKRIYLVDLTGSMEGKGSVVTPNILQTVKDNLAATIDNIEDENTEVIIVPFTDRVWESFSGRITDKQTIITGVKELKVLSGDTNIADAWSYGTTLLDSTKINYLFLLTDGLHNNGPSKEELFDRLRSWEQISKGKYNYAFYVMLTPNAKETEICEIVDSTNNMWLIESMDINASLVRTSITTRKNVFNDNTMGMSFLSNNRNANLDNLGLKIKLQDNDFYRIDSLRKSPLGNIYYFDIVELLPRLQLPLDTTFTMYFSYDTLANPFVFMTPDRVEFQIINQGPRELSIATVHNKRKGVSDINLKKLKYKEPFLGVFKWARKVFEPTLNWIPYSWAKSDTASTTTELVLTWNEEAVRAGSSVYFRLADQHNGYIDHIKVINGIENKPIYASTLPDSISLYTTIIPDIPSSSFKGDVITITDDVDIINEKELTNDESIIGSWRLEYKRGWPLVLWLLWIITVVLIIILIYYIVVWSMYLWVIVAPVLSSLIGSIKLNPSKGLKNGVKYKGAISNPKRGATTDGYASIGKDYNVIRDPKSTASQKYAAIKEIDSKYREDPSLEQQRYDEMPQDIRDVLDKYQSLRYTDYGYNHIPKENGIWSGKPGSSTFHPDRTFHPKNKQYNNLHDKSWGQILDENSTKGIRFKDGEPDFTPIAKMKATLDFDKDISETARAQILSEKKNRQQLHIEFYNKLAKEQKCSVQQIISFKEKNNLVVHECSDCKTLLLIPREIHDNIAHTGGIEMFRMFHGMK